MFKLSVENVLNQIKTINLFHCFYHFLFRDFAQSLPCYYIISSRQYLDGCSWKVYIYILRWLGCSVTEKAARPVTIYLAGVSRVTIYMTGVNLVTINLIGVRSDTMYLIGISPISVYLAGVPLVHMYLTWVSWQLLDIWLGYVQLLCT